jgi:hypothetical protein
MTKRKQSFSQKVTNSNKSIMRQRRRNERISHKILQREHISHLKRQILNQTIEISFIEEQKNLITSANTNKNVYSSRSIKIQEYSHINDEIKSMKHLKTQKLMYKSLQLRTQCQTKILQFAQMIEITLISWSNIETSENKLSKSNTLSKMKHVIKSSYILSKFKNIMKKWMMWKLKSKRIIIFD